jgi:hypothetical protein
LILATLLSASQGMNWWEWFIVAFGGLIVAWALAVATLIVGGKRTDARALAGFIPDCLVLLRRLLAATTSG